MGGIRLSTNDIWKEYSEGKQIYEQLAVKYGCSRRAIQRKLDSVDIIQKKSFEFLANVLIDTTYFGRTFGVMVFKKIAWVRKSF